jgi:CspA family cold shock protein
MTGTIKRLIADRHFGFIRAQNGQEVFFHASAVNQNEFGSLRVGQEVNFELERGEKGPKAVNVRARRETPLS